MNPQNQPQDNEINPILAAFIILGGIILTAIIEAI